MKVKRPTLQAADIQSMTTRINQVVTHPEFVKLAQELELVAAEERPRFVAEFLNPQALAQRGIPIPEGLRVTIRYFEDPDAAVLESKRAGTGQFMKPGQPADMMLTGRPWTICASVGWILCISVGAQIP